MILGDMVEAVKNEIYIEEIDAGSLEIMMNFIYTGDFQLGDTTDVQGVAYAADKYLIPGFMDLLCFKMRTENIKNEFIADLLIAADLHGSTELRTVALDKLRADRNIINEEGFRGRMMKAKNKHLIFDLINDL